MMMILMITMPLSSLPEDAFTHLNTSLRGLSLGGRFLTCDCRIRWVTTWIRTLDLQVMTMTLMMMMMMMIMTSR